MGWTPDVIAGVTIAVVFAVVGWGGSAYCWWHKKHVPQGEISTVDKWLTKTGTTGAGVAGMQAGYAAPIEMQRPRQRDPERDAGVVEGVDTMGAPQVPPPVYEPQDRHRDTRHPEEVPAYQERT
ncbi:uncharacterized protein HMPREF1541_06175 [Cyphellophora europaea CBS 101466]|uniref:Uncharacterized protein n=1 Tax=Cyphellophora europaea (strain CBS 101466) TaxID=1220924 RepID=W2RW16_CYPE1|nr:uncharacterized protein HMPREF1541_06175 [Cyphellophora europaea CBS 101466]ETN39948.1 hypothetical protein HMPREF1541_06175 [Cyphellophora europaea CBS 101466]